MDSNCQSYLDVECSTLNVECSPTLVIGWGSELRGDDMAGLEFIRRLQALDCPGVTTIETPQLTPELAWDVARSKRAIFVDAVVPGSPEGSSAAPVIKQMTGNAGSRSNNRLIPTCVHSLSPESLLDLAQMLYGAQPEGWLLYLPAESFDIGFELSEHARCGIEQALESILPYLIPDHQEVQPEPILPAL